MNKITTINGILMATQNDFTKHAENTTTHITEKERTFWNTKADASELATKVNTNTFSTHTKDTTAHVASEERMRWNSTPELDASGNMALVGNLTARCGTFSNMLEANEGINIPQDFVSTGQEALNYSSLVRTKIREYASRFKYSTVTWANFNPVVPAYFLYQYWERKCLTSNVSLIESSSAKSNFVQMNLTSKTDGMTLGVMVSEPYIGQRLGEYESRGFSCCGTFFSLRGPANASFIFGGDLGYGLITNSGSDNYSHPIHWAISPITLNDPRFPRSNSVNRGETDREEKTSYQVGVFFNEYLGSQYSHLIRGTRYDDFGTSRYCWGIIPKNIIKDFLVTQGPVVSGTDDQGSDFHYYWRLFAGRPGKYVMQMRGSFCGSGHTVAAGWGIKAYSVDKNITAFVSPIGFSVNADPTLLPSSTQVPQLLDDEVMKNEIVKPLPTVEASTQEVPASGGEVTLEVSSRLPEAIYVLNDTMGGNSPSSTWCQQSTEQIMAGGGQVTLTLEPNETGIAREVWVFVGHHYAEAIVVRINQLA